MLQTGQRLVLEALRVQSVQLLLFSLQRILLVGALYAILLLRPRAQGGDQELVFLGLFFLFFPEDLLQDFLDDPRQVASPIIIQDRPIQNLIFFHFKVLQLAQLAPGEERAQGLRNLGLDPDGHILLDEIFHRVELVGSSVQLFMDLLHVFLEARLHFFHIGFVLFQLIEDGEFPLQLLHVVRHVLRPHLQLLDEVLVAEHRRFDQTDRMFLLILELLDFIIARQHLPVLLFDPLHEFFLAFLILVLDIPELLQQLHFELHHLLELFLQLRVLEGNVAHLPLDRLHHVLQLLVLHQPSAVALDDPLLKLLKHIHLIVPFEDTVL
mmetsp:Transcript_681/g.731  ORF Transcript_681/g.731 Transcript_681/m.731 type:complete len:324 (-) Transcript_681:456-1427(-)